MKATKAWEKLKNKRPGIKFKLTVSLLAIAVILLVSSIISVFEYSRMSHYVSDLIAKDVNCINIAREIGDWSNEYNLEILAVIGDGTVSEMPDFNASVFTSHCDSLRNSLASNAILHLADSVEYSYAAYMITAMELENVLRSDFIDSRAWFFERLQPKFNRLRSDIDALSNEIHRDLAHNSRNFDRGIYRSIIPQMVAVGVGLLMVLMLLFFVIVYYVNPLCNMLLALKRYKQYGIKYSLDFEGDDQLRELSEGISDVISENYHLRRKLHQK